MKYICNVEQVVLAHAQTFVDRNRQAAWTDVEKAVFARRGSFLTMIAVSCPMTAAALSVEHT